MSNVNFSLCSLILVLLIHVDSFSQSASEALRYSLNRPIGTSRYLATGESMTSLGADYSAIAVNPAGLGLFRKSDFFVSLGWESAKTNSQLLASFSGNKSYEDERYSTHFNGIGIVFVGSPMASPWKNVNFSLNLVRTADFSSDSYYQGKSHGSITDRFLERSLDPNGTGLLGLDPDNLDDFEAGLAYETGAVFDKNIDPEKYYYTTDLLNHPGFIMPKEQNIERSGGMYDFSLALAANYNEVVALGASINIPFGHFKSKSVYKESENTRDEVVPFRNLQFSDRLKTSFSGIGMTLGVIYKPVKFIRLGLAWHSPQLLTMKDDFETALQYTFYNGRRDTSLSAESPLGLFEYKLTLPMRTVFSAALLGPYGFLSADVDLINPQQASYNLTTESFNTDDREFQNQVNEDIDKQYQAVFQYRFGGELALSKLRIRAGYQILQQPYSNVDEFDKAYSFGLGYRGNRFYIDLGFRNMKTNQAFAPYLTGESDFDGNGTVDAPTPLVSQTIENNLFLLTLGWKL